MVNDMPFLNTVDINESGYTVVPDFNQYLSQYHSAKLPIYDEDANAMHTIFFGGMSQFYLDDSNELTEDTEVPFVKTISKITRLSNGNMSEYALNYIEMPALLGAGAEFIPANNDLYTHGDILKINEIPNSKTLVGYIYGGIQSSAKNIFFINDGNQSFASNTIFKVYINKSTVNVNEYEVASNTVNSTRIFPNPAKKQVSIEYFVPNSASVSIDILDLNGKLIKSTGQEYLNPGSYTTEIDITDLEKGTYIVQVNNGKYKSNYKFIKK